MSGWEDSAGPHSTLRTPRLSSDSPFFYTSNIAMEKLEIDVPKGIPKTRIDLYLVQAGVPLSRSRIKRLIQERRIEVVGKGTKPNFILRGGEKIIVRIPDEPNIKLEAEPIKLNIVYEDDYLLVVNKPAGMVVHPSKGHHSGTLLNAIMHHTTQLSPVGGDLRPGIVHRLDKDTSGLLIIAKSERAHLALSNALAERRIHRRYVAIIWGHPATHSGRIDLRLGRHPKEPTKVGVVPNGVVAITDYTSREYFDFLTLVDVTLQTGRTHQIRVHFSHTGHPVFGDYNYSGREERIGGIDPKYRPLANRLLKIIDRQALHAIHLDFDHPISREHLSLESDIPDDMSAVLRVLRGETE